VVAESPFQVLWRDADPAGWIHYAAVSRYFEEVECALFERAGIVYADQLALGRGFPRVHFESEFRRPLQVHDRGVARAAVAAVGRTSITLRFELAKHGEDEAAVVGSLTMVMVDWATKRPVEVPPELRTELTREEVC
jgi:acyl-CoA thioester hydrolase